jgi:hypothetical protein
MLLYEVNGNKNYGYGKMHKCAKKFQDMLESNYHVTLGYSFKDKAVSEVWDKEFQHDIERYDVVDNIVRNSDLRVPGTEQYYTHNLHLNPTAEFLLKTAAKDDIESHLPVKLEALKKQISQECNTRE